MRTIVVMSWMAGVAFHSVCVGADAKVKPVTENGARADASVVTYEAFGALGDGVADDLPAICKAHTHANAKLLPVRAKPGATYHLGGKALTAIIATDTDWGTSRFIIDDRQGVEKPSRALFEVRSLRAPLKLELEKLRKGQERLDVRLEADCVVHVVNDQRRVFIRYGPNRNEGSPLQEVFILRKDGKIEGGIDWDYDQLSKVTAMPIDEQTLTLRGGIFTSIACQEASAQTPSYWGRNIQIRRSNTVVEGMVHHVTGEGKEGNPYRGFFSVLNCANVVIRKCEIDGRKHYKRVGSAGVPVSVGTYGYHADLVINLQLKQCRMKDIHDTSRWGIVGTNFMKDFLVEECSLSRVDVHQGVSGSYIVRRSTIGHAGINAIGRGRLIVEDSTLCNDSLVRFREDYGSTWEGEVIIRNCRWTPTSIPARGLVMFVLQNKGTHDFGYPCFMPRSIQIDGLSIDDAKQPKKGGGLVFFDKPTGSSSGKQPFPYRLTERISIQKLKTTSGGLPRVSNEKAVTRAVVLSPRDALQSL